MVDKWAELVENRHKESLYLFRDAYEYVIGDNEVVFNAGSARGEGSHLITLYLYHHFIHSITEKDWFRLPRNLTFSFMGKETKRQR